jgi:hypothetical protein
MTHTYDVELSGTQAVHQHVTLTSEVELRDEQIEALAIAQAQDGTWEAGDMEPIIDVDGIEERKALKDVLDVPDHAVTDGKLGEQEAPGEPVIDIRVPCYLRLVDPEQPGQSALLYLRRGSFGSMSSGFRVFLFPDVPALPLDPDREARASAVIDTSEKLVIVYDGDMALGE